MNQTIDHLNWESREPKWYDHDEEEEEDITFECTVYNQTSQPALFTIANTIEQANPVFHIKKCRPC